MFNKTDSTDDTDLIVRPQPKAPSLFHEKKRFTALRRVACVTGVVFSWMALSPGIAAAASEIETLTTRPTGHRRALSPAERRHIFGAKSSNMPLTIADEEAGAPHSWESQVGGTSTSSLNKLTTQPIVGWSGRGPGISLALFHNSRGLTNAAVGKKWTHSYNVYLADNMLDSNLQLVEGSGQGNLFTQNIDGSYSAPPGVHDTLTVVSGGYNLTRKDQSVWHFNAAKFLTSITDRNGNAVTLSYDSTNHLLSVTDAVGRSLTFGWDTNKTRILSITDPTSRVWTLSYSGVDLAGVTEPTINGATYSTSFGYDSASHVTSKTDKRGKVWSFTYTGDGISTETDPLSHTTSYATGTASGVTTTTITDPNSHSVTHKYSTTTGDLVEVDDALNNAETYGYDSSHNKTSSTDRRGKVTTATYDSQGNVLTTTDPLNRTVTNTYSGANDLLTTTLPSGRQVVKLYDTAGNCTSVTDPDSNVTNFTYNTDGTLATKTDSNSRTTAYAYNSYGSLSSVTTPGGKVTASTYNTLGTKTSRTDALGHVTGYTVDAWQRVTAVDYDSATSSADQTFTYDANSNLTAFADGTGSTSRTYDDLNRITTETTGAGTVSYAYDATGEKGLLNTITDPSSRSISYNYTANNRIAAVYDSGTGGTTSYAYNAADMETGVLQSNGVTVAKTYNDAGEITSVVNQSAGSATLSSFAYTYTADGQKSSLTEDTGAVVSYTYNNAGRLTSEGRTGSTSYSASYTVDGEGNRTSQTVGGVTRTFAYDTDDALLSTSVGGTVTTAYSYNGNGEQTGRTLGGVSYTLGYDGEGQMVSLTDGANNKSYEYDALGRRASRTAGGVTTEFVRVGDTNGGQVLQEVQGTTVTASYTYGNALIGKGSDVNLYDGQGSSRQTTGSTGSITSSRVYEGFGSVVASTGGGENYGYAATSGYRDDGDAGLSHVGARYYDAAVGRFITRDSYLNQKPYTYCEGDPVNNLDPDGHQTRSERIAIANIEITAGAQDMNRGFQLYGAGAALIGVLLAIPVAAGLPVILGVGLLVAGATLLVIGVNEYSHGVERQHRGYRILDAVAPEYAQQAS